MAERQLYKIAFYNQEQVYELYVKHISQDELYGFVLIEDFVFGEKSGIVVDPTEEKLRLEFEGVQRSFIPMHQVIRIDQVKKRGTAKIVSIDKNSSGKAGLAYTQPKK
ncbi:MAG: DUF1820 family protein [Gammaproteobacteria bacterium]